MGEDLLLKDLQPSCQASSDVQRKGIQALSEQAEGQLWRWLEGRGHAGRGLLHMAPEPCWPWPSLPCVSCPGVHGNLKD